MVKVTVEAKVNVISLVMVAVVVLGPASVLSSKAPHLI